MSEREQELLERRECRYWLVREAEWEVALNLSQYPEPCGDCNHCSDASEGQSERANEDYYGGSGPQTDRERQLEAYREKYK